MRTPVPELAEGALPKQYIYTVAHASGSESSVLFPWLILLLLPMPMLILNSVAMLLLILILPSVKFRVRPWQMLLFPSVSLLLSFP